MLVFALFIFSGLGILSIFIAKRYELKNKQTIFVINIISKGDSLVRDWYQKSLIYYDEGKSILEIRLKKQIPLRIRALVNKLYTNLELKSKDYFERARDSRLIKKSDGISDFFKSISEIEKGAGEINETLNEEYILSKSTPLNISEINQNFDADKSDIQESAEKVSSKLEEDAIDTINKISDEISISSERPKVLKKIKTSSTKIKKERKQAKKMPLSNEIKLNLLDDEVKPVSTKKRKLKVVEIL